MPKLSLALVSVALFGALAVAQTPSLTGIWHWNPSKSSQMGNQRPEDMFLNLDQSASDLTVKSRVRVRGDEMNETYKFKVGGDASKYDVNGVPTSGTAKWEGSTLVINSASGSGARELKMEERYTLSPDGKTLTVATKRQFGNQPAAEVTYVYDKQEGAWEADRAPKKMEEMYKNIQVLNGVPAARLRTIMGNFNRSLGVECSHCHVQGNFAADEKPAKNMARAMVKMNHAINADNFHGAPNVTCWTCHRGSVHPQTSAE